MGRNLEAFIMENYQKAIDRHEIQAFYQPVIRTSSRQLCSFEALARWVDPELGMIYPDEFIPVLEREKMIHLLDIAILRQVCARIRSCIASGETLIPVSVNLSRLDFALCDIFTIADEIVCDYQIPHDFVCFEITESVMAEQKDLLMGIVERFRGAGYQIWMDDFGSAYSSLNVLKEFSFDELKLDMSFLRPFVLRSKRIVASVIRMAKVIDIHTLAEGVETEEQFAYLRDVGCEKVQGYYFGRPMSYEKALENVLEQGIQIELSQDRFYYEEIGKIDYLSGVPFMKREEFNAIGDARKLNSIPLMLVEFFEDSFRVLFYNTAFEETVQSVGIMSQVFTQDMLCKRQGCHLLTPKIQNLMDSVKVNGDGRMLFTVNAQYFEIKARRMVQTWNKYCILVSVNNLTKDTQPEKREYLDDRTRQIYSLFERITLINYKKDIIRPLYTDIREDLLSTRQGISRMVEEYAARYIYPDDRGQFLQFLEPEAAVRHLKENGSVSFSEIFRTNVRHGQYAWKEYTLLKIDEENDFLLVRNIHEEAKKLLSGSQRHPSEDGVYSEVQLWNNLIHSDLIKLFWKDLDRRFLGVSQSFLDFYGFSSADEVIGRTDEELGWHVHPDLYMNEEYKVIHEGISYRNMPGYCMSHGVNREILASKTPLYDGNGEITGLIGYFIDKDLLDINDQRGEESPRRDFLTGLLNSRGIWEEAELFQDEYYLRGTDFVRIHIEVNDFSTLNEQYGFDFGDQVLRALGYALSEDFGIKSAIGRYAGRNFAILKQVEDKKEVLELRTKIKEIGNRIREVDGKPVTLYLSVGFAMFSEYPSVEEQKKNAEMFLHADNDLDISAESRINHALEIFRMFDDLPVTYAVFHVTYAENSGQYNAVFFYVNHKYEEYFGRSAKQLLGYTVRETFPLLGDDWYRDVKSAALDGAVVEGEFDNPLNGKHFHFTARQILYPGYCAITCIEIPRAQENRKLLIVSDMKSMKSMENMENMESMRTNLVDFLAEDYEIFSASDGDEAIKTIRMLRRQHQEISLLILDLYAQDRTGRELMAKFQENPELKSVPVMVLTAEQEAELEYLKMGATDFIRKPFPDIEIVKARISRCIALSEMH